MKRRPNRRDQKIVTAYRDGASAADLGRKYNISRERVRQILVREHEPRRDCRVSTEVKQQVVEMYKEGKTYPQIAEVLSVSSNRVGIICRDAGATPRPGTRVNPLLRLTPKLRAEIVSRRLTGELVDDLAEEYGFHPATLAHLFGEEGIVLQPESTATQRAEMVWLYKKGYSMRAVADRVGFSVNTVKNALKRADVPRRGPGGDPYRRGNYQPKRD